MRLDYRFSRGQKEEEEEEENQVQLDELYPTFPQKFPQTTGLRSLEIFIFFNSDFSQIISGWNVPIWLQFNPVAVGAQISPELWQK